MRFPANCLVVAAIASLRPGNSMRWKRNRSGRVHFYWIDSNGRSWEFYTKGASGETYWRNSLRLGDIKRTK